MDLPIAAIVVQTNAMREMCGEHGEQKHNERQQITKQLIQNN